MLREKRNFIIQFYRFFDIFISILAFIGAFYYKKYLIPEDYRGLIDLNYYAILLLIIIIWYISLGWFNVYLSFRNTPLITILTNTIKAAFTALLILILSLYLIKIVDVSRILISMFFLLNIGLLIISKTFIYKLLSRVRGKGYNIRNVLIIGSRSQAKDIIRAIDKDPGTGYRIIGCLDKSKKYIGKKVYSTVNVIGTINQLENILSDQVVDEMVIAMPLKLIQHVEMYILMAEKMGVPVRVMPNWKIHRLKYKPGGADIAIEEFAGIPTTIFLTTPLNRGALLLKTIFDYILAIVASLIVLPFIPIIIIAIKLSSKGPVIFKQERLGLNGRRFTMYKFRTMVEGAEAMQAEIIKQNESSGPAFKIKKDPRIIPVIGSLLRKTSLDELPQLINIFKGEMSIVGPRPPIPSEASEYEIWQRRRLSVKPGLTCIWQTSADRNDISFEDWMNMDLKYIDNWELWLDIKIILQTAGVMLTGTGR